MDQKPLVTVVTVSYNSSRFIRDSIESVLAQTYGRIEYIIGDDCSTDDTWQIIQQYNDPRIYRYRNELNLGEYANRNKALGMATGKYLIFIDGDDLIFPHGISFFVDMMERFPGAGMAIQKNYFNNILYPLLFEPDETLRNHFYGRNNLLNSSFTSDFFRTDCLKRWNLSTNYMTGDEEIRLRIAAHYPVLFVAGWVSWPRETPGQASSRLTLVRSWEEKYKFSNDTLESLRASGFNPALIEDIHSVLRRDFSKIILYLLSRGRWNEMKNLFQKTGFSWSEVFKYRNYRAVFGDPLSDYDASSPLKKGFLKDGISQNLPYA